MSHKNYRDNKNANQVKKIKMHSNFLHNEFVIYSQWIKLSFQRKSIKLLIQEAWCVTSENTSIWIKIQIKHMP